MKHTYIELHTKEGKYFVKCYKSEKPIKHMFKAGKNYFKSIYENALKIWQQSEVIYPVHESQVMKCYDESTGIYRGKISYDKFKELLKQGITLPASKVKIENGFAFLVEEVKEETNEAVEIKLGHVFEVEGKKYMITKPSTDSQLEIANPHGHIVITLSQI